MISIKYQNKIYNIETEPFESIENSYKRGWYIIKNINKYSYDELYSLSLMYINKKNGMKYEENIN